MRALDGWCGNRRRVATSPYPPPALRATYGGMRLASVRLVALVLLSWALGGCSLFNGLDVKSVATSVQKPSNVALYLAVSDGDQPVTDLTEQNFQVLENGQPVDPEQSGLTLLDRNVAAVHRTLLLVDMSGKANEKATRTNIARAAAGFVADVHKLEDVTVYAFDGSPELRLIGEYPESADDGPDNIQALADFVPRDPSRDLDGAVIQALEQLDARLMIVKKPVRIGTLVVFTRGPDLAGRTPKEKVSQALDKTDHEVFAIGIGKDKGDFDLDRLGRAGVVRAPSMGSLGIAFENAASKIRKDYNKYYLLSYCSPARAGERALRIKVTMTDKQGDQHEGSYSTEFDSAGFGPGCNPHATPRFVMKAKKDSGAREAPAPKPSEAPKPSGASKPTEPPATPSQPPSEGGDQVVPPPSKPGYAPTPDK